MKIPKIVMSAEAEQVEMQDANENSVSWPGIALENSRLPAKLDLCTTGWYSKLAAFAAAVSKLNNGYEY